MEAKSVRFEVERLYHPFMFLFCPSKEGWGCFVFALVPDFVKAAAWSKHFEADVKICEILNRHQRLA